MRVHALRLVGPIDAAMRSLPIAHRRWFAQGPTLQQWQTDEGWKPALRKLLSPFLTRAYRRPPPEEEIDRLIDLVEAARLRGDSYQRSMQLVVEVVLVSPRFLFIGNLDAPAPTANPSQVSDFQARSTLIDEYELASRLSYFLWSSAPDQQLMRLAAAGELRQQLKPQLKRMLRDRRSEQLFRNFTGQWLGTRMLQTLEPDEQLFATFNPNLAAAMTTEAERVFAEVVQSDAPITTLLDADFTYLNELLAKHYGIPGVEGNYFRRVSLAELPASVGPRGGVLTMAGLLAVTSNPNRTSPVKRGKWILGELLGKEPPPPPPGTPSLDQEVRIGNGCQYP